MNQTPTTQGGSDQLVRESLFLYECSLWYTPYGYAESEMFCDTSTLWSWSALICRSMAPMQVRLAMGTMLSYAVPQGLPSESTRHGNPHRQLHCRLPPCLWKACGKSRLLPGVLLRTPLIHKPCHSTYLLSSLSVPCAILVYTYHTTPYKACASCIRCSYNLLQRCKVSRWKHQWTQLPTSHSLRWDVLWNSQGTAPASTPLKATALWMHITCFPDGIMGLFQLTRTKLGKYLQEAKGYFDCTVSSLNQVWQGDFTFVQRLVVLSSRSLEKMVTTDRGTAGWNPQVSHGTTEWQGLDGTSGDHLVQSFC